MHTHILQTHVPYTTNLYPDLQSEAVQLEFLLGLKWLMGLEMHTDGDSIPGPCNSFVGLEGMTAERSRSDLIAELTNAKAKAAPVFSKLIFACSLRTA
jgi:hypothetical protein